MRRRPFRRADYGLVQRCGRRAIYQVTAEALRAAHAAGKQPDVAAMDRCADLALLMLSVLVFEASMRRRMQRAW